MSDSTISASETCEVAECVPSTLRAWHNRLGLLRRDNPGKWRRYTLADTIAVRLMVILTDRGFQAQDAVKIIDSIQGEIENAAHGFGSMLAIGRVNGLLTIEQIDGFDYAHTALDFDDEFIAVIKLGRIALHLFNAIRELRGLPPLSQSITEVEIIGLGKRKDED